MSRASSRNFWKNIFDSNPYSWQKRLRPNHDIDLRSPASFEPEEVKTWVRLICDTHFLKPSSLAKDAGISPSTLNRFLSGNSKNLNLNVNTIKMIGSVVERRGWTVTEDGSDEIKYNALELKGSYRPTRVVEITPGLHIERGRFDQIPWINFKSRFKLQIPYSNKFAGHDFTAGVVFGDGLLPAFTSGSVVICRLVSAASPTEPDGTRMLVSRRSGDLVDLDIREVLIDPKGRVWLKSLQPTTDASDMIFLDVPGSPLPDDVFVVGAVTCAYLAP